jgi:hypothetical protein
MTVTVDPARPAIKRETAGSPCDHTMRLSDTEASRLQVNRRTCAGP